MGFSFDKEFEFKGEFWISSDSEKKVTGKLYYDYEEGIILTLNKEFPSNPTEVEIINGVKYGGQSLTLLNAIFTSSKGDFKGSYEVIYNCEFLLYGELFSQEREMSFNKLSFGFTNLEEWFCHKPYEIVTNDNYEWSISNVYLPSKKIEIQTGLNLKTNSSFTKNIKSKQEIDLSFRTYFTFEADSKITLEYYIEAIKLIQNFLTLSMDSSCSTKFIKGLSQSDKFYGIDIVRGKSFENDYKKVHSHDMILSYNDFNTKFEEVFINLFELKNKFESIVNLFTANYYKSDTYQELRFLNLTQAFEAYFRLTKETSYLPENEFDKFRRQIVDSLPKSKNISLNAKLKSIIKYANEFSLRKKMKEFISSFEEDTIAFFGLDSSFIDKIVSTRNYYTHYDKSLKEDAEKGIELTKLEIKLRYILTLYLFRDLGLNELFILEKIKKNKRASYFIKSSNG